MRGQKKTSRKLNNKGFSFVELLVAVALMGILVGLASYSVAVMKSGDTKRASKAVSNNLSALRVNTLAVQADWQLEIVNEDGQYLLRTYKNGTANETEKLGSQIKVYYQSATDAGLVEIPKDSKLIVKYAAGSGKVSGMYTTTSSLDSWTDVSVGALPVATKGFCEFKFTTMNGGGEETFKLYYETGTIVHD